jgi:hypothetical protein
MLKLPSFADESFVDDCCVIELVVRVSCIGMQILSRLRAVMRTTQPKSLPYTYNRSVYLEIIIVLFHALDGYMLIFYIGDRTIDD